MVATTEITVKCIECGNEYKTHEALLEELDEGVLVDCGYNYVLCPICGSKCICLEYKEWNERQRQWREANMKQ
jgi:DNA-directed RNA polymerase subunit RPC12/RpoP